MLQLIATHKPWAVGVLVFIALAALAPLLILATRDRDRTGRHSRAKGIYRGKPTEIRRHCAKGDRAWPGTFSIAPRPAATVHRVDDAAPQRDRAANRYEDTGEITMADLEALLGPRPEAVAA